MASAWWTESEKPRPVNLKSKWRKLFFIAGVSYPLSGYQYRHDDHWQGLRCDLASSMRACTKEVGRIVGKQLMDSSPPQTTSASVVHYKPVFVKKWNDCAFTSSTLTRFAPFDFFLFDKLKDSLWGIHFGDVEAVKAESVCLLNVIPESD